MHYSYDTDWQKYLSNYRSLLYPFSEANLVSSATITKGTGRHSCSPYESIPTSSRLVWQKIFSRRGPNSMQFPTQVVLIPIHSHVCIGCRQHRDLAYGDAGLGFCHSALDWWVFEISAWTCYLNVYMPFSIDLCDSMRYDTGNHQSTNWVEVRHMIIDGILS